MLVPSNGMDGTEDRFVGMDTGEDVHVANPGEGIFVFYATGSEEYIRTDTVVDLSSMW